eukprot:c16999_g1_i1.p2 GENE.c16999_g1_i1~~c16999_g1_i1.p2  ORF type:complete len:156 (+),score=35.19 c16999_g1_i1:750-1217(+)
MSSLLGRARMLWAAYQAVGLKGLMRVARPATMTNQQLANTLEFVRNGGEGTEKQLDMISKHFATLKTLKDIQEAEMAELRKQDAEIQQQAVAEADASREVTGLPPPDDHSGKFRVNPRYGHLWLTACQDQAASIKTLEQSHTVKRVSDQQKKTNE